MVRISFSRIPQVITALESAGTALVDALRIADNFANEMGALNGRRLLSVTSKTHSMFKNNAELQELRHIPHVIKGNMGTFNGLTAADVSDLRFAPIVSADVERPFSRYKSFLRDNRKASDFENLKKNVVALCNSDA